MLQGLLANDDKCLHKDGLNLNCNNVVILCSLKSHFPDSTAEARSEQKSQRKAERGPFDSEGGLFLPRAALSPRGHKFKGLTADVRIQEWDFGVRA